MAMLLGPANGSIKVRHVLYYVREGALPSNHTIPTMSLFPPFKYKHSKNKMLRVLQMVTTAQVRRVKHFGACSSLMWIFFLRN